MFKTLFSILKTAGIAVLFSGLVVKAWSMFSPHPTATSHTGKKVLAQFVAAAVGDLLHDRGGVRTAALLPLNNDPHATITQALRSGINNSHALALQPRSAVHAAVNGLHLAAPTNMTLLPALRVARKARARGAVFGTVHNFLVSAAGARLDCTVALASVARGRIIFQKDYKFNTIPATATAASAAPRDGGPSLGGWLVRLLIWAGLVLLLPLGALPTIRATVRKASNRLNAVLLCVLTAIDALLAYLLLNAGFGSFLAALAFIVFACAAVAYNLQIMAHAARAEGP